MDKLIAAYEAKPTGTNMVRLLKYLNKHPMAVCMATPKALTWLKANGFI